MIDVDHFKKVNDTYGHAVGDIALRKIAGALQRSVRSIDVVGRLGGEEFVAVLPETGEESAAHVAERLRADVASEKIAVDELQNLSLTISIGGAILIPGETLTQLLTRADQSLYQAKAAGRNRVVFAASS
jgi:diguanylate cyclase (GGDEF)-like protein